MRYAFESSDKLVLLIELILDPGVFCLNGIFFFLDSCDLLVELLLPFLALLQLEFDVSRALRLSHLSLQKHDLVVQGLLLLFCYLRCQ